MSIVVRCNKRALLQAIICLDRFCSISYINLIGFGMARTADVLDELELRVAAVEASLATFHSFDAFVLQSLLNNHTGG
jgi:hypothetical protein